MKSMKVWKKICLAWLSIACLLGVVIALFYVIENVSGRKAWERYVRECETKNQTAASDLEKTYLWIEDIIPPAVDEEKNFANIPLFKEVFRRAKEGCPFSSDSEDETMRLLLKAMDGWRWKGMPDYSKLSRADFEKIEDLENRTGHEEMSKEECIQFMQKKLEPGLAGYKEIQKALKEKSQCRYPVEYENGYATLMPHLSVIKKIALTAAMCGHVKLALGQSGEALENLFFIMDLADTVSNEPNQISALIKIAAYRFAMNMIWEGIESDSWTPENLRLIQERLKKDDTWNTMRLGLIGERAFVNTTFQKYPDHLFDIISEELFDLENDTWSKMISKLRPVVRSLIPQGWHYRALLEYNKAMDLVLSCLDMDNKCFKEDTFQSPLNELANPEAWKIRGIPSSVVKMFKLDSLYHSHLKYIMKFALAQSTINEAKIACTLELYRIENKKYPDSLDDLGELLPKEELPKDCINSKPLQYRLTDEGYILWSVGKNGTDEGGIRSRLDDNGDWVWEIKRGESKMKNEKIKLVRGDITECHVDAIVNAANRTLLGGGGVDGAIHRAAGPELLKECEALSEIEPGVRCQTGDAKLTRAYQLPAKYVIHTVGPVYQDGVHGETEKLHDCYQHSLELAVQNNCRSIAFPAISTGVYHFPPQQAAEIAVSTVKEFLSNHTDLEVLFVCFDRRTASIYHHLLSDE